MKRPLLGLLLAASLAGCVPAIAGVLIASSGGGGGGGGGGGSNGGNNNPGGNPPGNNNPGGNPPGNNNPGGNPPGGTPPVTSRPVRLALLAADGGLYEQTVDGASGGTATRVATLAVSQPVGLVAPTSGLVRTIDRAAGALVTCSRSTGATTTTTPLEANTDLARRGLTRTEKGRVYGVIAGTTLRYVEDNGQAYQLGTLTGASRVEALAADAWGGLWAAGSSGDDDEAEALYRVDLTNEASALGRLTLVGLFGVDLDGLTFGSDGRLYGLHAPAGSPATVWTVDLATGQATALAPTGIVDVVGFAEVPDLAPALATSGPWARRVVPDTVVSGCEVEVILEGEELGASTTITPEGSAPALLSDDAASSGEQRRIRLAAPRTLDTLVYRLTSAGGVTSRLRLQVLDSHGLVVHAGETVGLAGSPRLGGLIVEAGGTLRGVGLRPLLLFVDGPVQLDGLLDASGRTGTAPMGNNPEPPVRIFRCGDGGEAGPGGGGGGGGGAESVSDCARGGDGGWGRSGGGGGGGSPNYPSGRGGMGDAIFGGPPSVALNARSVGGAGGSGTGGGGGGLGGGGGGSGRAQSGVGGAGGSNTGQAPQVGVGGGAGGHHSSGGSGGGGGSHATAGQNGRLSDSGNDSGGGPAGLTYGAVNLVPLEGGSGGGGGSGRGNFNGLGGGGGGGGGAVVLASRASITVGPTGGVLVTGGRGQSQFNADGEAGAGSGGGLILQAPVIEHRTGGRVDARGGAEASSSSNYRGRGGDGRIRVDGATLRRDGGVVASGAFAAAATPPVGFFGTSPTTVVVGVSGSVQSGDVSLSYQPSDPDSNFVFVELEVSVDGAQFVPMRQAAASPPTHAVPAVGVFYTFVWDSRADTTPGPHNCVVRARATDGQVGDWSPVSPQFTITN